MKILHSKEDASINLILHDNIETRYVRRPGKDILYLSSQTGCSQLCKMCWLTATGQIHARNVTVDEYVEQLNVGINHLKFDLKERNEILHINFMARGEPLLNEHLADHWFELMLHTELMLAEFQKSYKPMYKKIVPIISSIIPKNMIDLSKFEYIKPRLYWSAYSFDHKFRKRWLPNALPFLHGMEKLQQYHEMGGEVGVHFAFIEGENDQPKNVENMARLLAHTKMPLKINIVRYNPPNDKSRESPIQTILENMSILKEILPTARIKMVDRIGTDVMASCGMFVEGE
jgi:adenine C2-methylase RlmN of 23S rRNA A2503 and tRNA A37